MIRPAPRSGSLPLAAALALVLASVPAWAEAPVVDPAAPAVQAEGPGNAERANEAAPLREAPPPPPLEPVEVPPAFDTQDAGGFLWSFVRSMLMLGAVLALIYLVLHKGLGHLVQRTQMGRRMRLVERIALDQRRALYLVEVDGKEVLLAGSDGGVSQVHLGSPAPKPAVQAGEGAVRFQVDRAKGGRPPETGRAEDGSSLLTSTSTNARESVEG